MINTNDGRCIVSQLNVNVGLSTSIGRSWRLVVAVVFTADQRRHLVNAFIVISTAAAATAAAAINQSCDVQSVKEAEGGCRDL